MKIKKTVSIFMIMTVMFSAVSCSGSEGKTGLSGSSAENSISESQLNVENIIIDALKNKDAEAVKNVFSKRAVERSRDLDSEIEKMFDIYKGSFEKITHSNFGKQEHAGEKAYKYYSKVCVFKTTENYYKLTWNEYTKNEKDPDLTGVYSMRFETWKDEGTDQGGEDLNLAGLFSSDSSDEIKVTQKLLTCIHKYDLKRIGHEDSNVESYMKNFNELLSEKALSSVKDEQINSFFEKSVPFSGLSCGSAWISYDQNNEKTICMLSDSEKYEGCYLCFKTEKDMIKCICVGKLKDNQSVEDCISVLNTSEVISIS